MLAIIPGMIAGSALTKSAKQVPNVEVPNVVTQASAAYCAYRSGWLSDLNLFGTCMAVTALPAGGLGYYIYRMGKDQIRDGDQVIRTGRRVNDRTIVELGKSLVRSGATLARFTPWGVLAVAA
jgi:hypothetical protein